MYDGTLDLYEADEYVTTQAIYRQLESWVEQGKRGIEKLRSFLYYEVDEELIGYANMLYREALVGYFMPETQQEMRDFVLSRLVMERQQYIFDQEVLLDVFKEELMTLRVQHSVDKDLFGVCSKDMLVTSDVIDLQKQQILNHQNHIKEIKKWIKVACQYIDDDRYVNPPKELFDFVDIEGMIDKIDLEEELV